MNPLIWQALVEGRAVQVFQGATPSMLDLLGRQAKELGLNVIIQEGRPLGVDDEKEIVLCDSGEGFELLELTILSVMERTVTAYRITIQAPQCAIEVKDGADLIQILGRYLYFYWSR